MRYLRQHIDDIIATYDGKLPLAHFLKNYFRQHPKLGSRDRKMLSAMAYNWYRFSKLHNDSMAQWLNEPSQWLNGPMAQWLNERDLDINDLFPFAIDLSEGITKNEWLRSMLVQPDLFIRVRKNKERILELLDEQKIPYRPITDDCLSLPNGAKIDKILQEDSYVVQDASSQKTGSFFEPKKNEQWYDCCSGAGGKSLLLKDKEPGVRLTVSDMRESILYNLQQRFRMYRLEAPVAHVVNVSDAVALEKTLGNKRFDNIICDVPCSGSGTWARTPEQLYFFDPKSVARFPPLQGAIATNAARYLRPGGKLFYITCSVFKMENEDVVARVLHETGLSLVHAQIINGVDVHADSMFIGVMERI